MKWSVWVSSRARKQQAGWIEKLKYWKSIMSVPTKKPPTKQDISIVIGKKTPRLFLVPKGRADQLVHQLKAFEVEEFSPARETVLDLIDQYTEAGAVLKGARLKEGLSQVALAKKIGITQSNLSEMENGRRPIGKAMAKRLSEVLKVSYRVFL